MLAIDTIEVTAEMLAAQGKAMPAPMIPADEYSGRVTLRLAKSLHRSPAQAADKEGASLNQHLTNILNYYAGYAQAKEKRHSENIWQSIGQPEKRKNHLRLISRSEPNSLKRQ